jgi:hypothetical protein
MLIPRSAVRCLALLVVGALSSGSPGQDSQSGVSFGRDIRPLLSDRCFQCHGPDSNKRQAGLRLDTFEFATKVEAWGAAIAPGRPQESELIKRISSADPGEVMPPPEAHRKALTPEEQDLLVRWVADGATYEEHWAFVPPRRQALEGAQVHPIDALVHSRLEQAGLSPSPRIEPALALRRLFLDLTGLPPTPGELDAFLAQLEEGAPEEVWRLWIARIFKEEPYASRYAERMASPWMDQARYADTSGIHMDAGRQIWPWRDWVLEAYRQNMPFDQFLTEQLAGDLLPEASVAQRVASGFNRNHVTTDEGGAIDAEYLVEYAADRVETTSSVFLGLTVGCARCHDHKFDPITQEDYYGLFAFFASNEEPGLYSQRPDPRRAFEPFLEVPSEEQAAKRLGLGDALAQARQELAEPSPEDLIALQGFRGELARQLELEWAPAEVVEARSTGGATLTVDEEGVVLSSGENPATDVQHIRLRTDATGLRLVQLDVLGHETFTKGAPGRASNGNGVLTGVKLKATSVRDPKQQQDLQVRWLWSDVDQDNEDWSLHRSLDASSDKGWAIAGHTDGAERAAFLLTDAPFGFDGGTLVDVTLEYQSIYANHVFGRIRLSLAKLADEGLASLPLSQGHWYHAGPFTPSGETSIYEQAFGPEGVATLNLDEDFEEASGKRVRWQYKEEFVDGKVTALPGGINTHYVAKEIFSPDRRSVEVSLGSDDGFVILLNGMKVADREVPRGVAPDQDRVTLDLLPGRNLLTFKVINTGGAAGFYFKALEGTECLSDDLVCALLETSARGDGGDAYTDRVNHAWRLQRSPEYKQGLSKIATLEEELTALEGGIARTMVMRERAEPRPTFVLERGQYDHANEERPVSPRIPVVFGDLPSDGERSSRLDLARWMTSPQNPLVARVAVNRLWQLVFGTGLVVSSGDFGFQGNWPSHPELLDWLAVEFVESGWDVQGLLTTIMTSETYRQSSAVRPEVLEIDPQNRLLAHYPRRRLEAELLRDQALYTAGLLVEQLGGPSVKPYHPEGLWREVAMLQSNTRIYERGEGDDLWRRSLYTYWKRACPPPSMMTFDAPTREACVIKRATTNTPLQALVLWNDEQFVEAARVLAERTLQAGKSDSAALDEMFRRCTGRHPSEREAGLLLEALADHRERYRGGLEDAAELISVGERPTATDVDPGELAAWTMLASALLNLHATITQG